MTGEGIYYAVATGIPAGRRPRARCLADRDRTAPAPCTAAVRPCSARHLKHTWTAARLAETAVVEAGIRAARRDRRVFDQLVELGLGDGRIGPRLGGPGPRSSAARDPDPPVRREGSLHADPVRPRRAAAAPLPAGRDHRRVRRGGHRPRQPRRGGCCAASTPTPASSLRHTVLPLEELRRARRLRRGQRPVHRARRRPRRPRARRRAQGRRPDARPTSTWSSPPRSPAWPSRRSRRGSPPASGCGPT